MVASIALPRSTKGLESIAASPANNICPDCGADAPVTTPEGFTVCSACGCEYPDSQPYVCSDALARGGGVVQSHMILAPHTRRTIGTRAEQATLPRALAWGEKISVTFEQEVFMRAYFEIRKIFAALDLDYRAVLFDAAMAGFVMAYKAALKGSRNRNVHLLALVSAYRAMRAAKVPILMKPYLATCLDHDRTDTRYFLAVLKDTAAAFPRTNLGEIVSSEVSALVSRLSMPKDLKGAIMTVLKHHRATFRSPKTGVRAAAIVSAAVLATNKRQQFTLSSIAQSAGVATSAVIRCITEACAHRHRPLEGSLVHAGELVRSLFLAPPDIVKIEVHQITRVRNPPQVVLNAAASISENYAGAFLQRSPKAAAGAIINTSIHAKGGHKTCRLKTVTPHTQTTYLSIVSSIKRACQRLGHPPPVKILRAGSHLRAQFLDGPPGHYGVHHWLSSPVAQEGPPPAMFPAPV